MVVPLAVHQQEGLVQVVELAAQHKALVARKPTRHLQAVAAA